MEEAIYECMDTFYRGEFFTELKNIQDKASAITSYANNLGKEIGDFKVKNVKVPKEYASLGVSFDKLNIHLNDIQNLYTNFDNQNVKLKKLKLEKEEIQAQIVKAHEEIKFLKLKMAALADDKNRKRKKIIILLALLLIISVLINLNFT